ncbi:hypothetical protein DYB31_012634 [Aphanomyces astaci]|uniref:Calpain catalytic domain-containing protein n=1 Tax=Aphanomyces astaci TaxID=112090 RepID=A0A397FFE6_APHAT|nr:hypothetical protein DYB31_012634 [Aphanomyces astaci]
MVWPSPHELEQQYNDEGVYCVRFWRNHKSYLVVVDDFIPCNHNGKPAFASFTGTASRFEIWSMLVEKAYAKLYGGYDMIVGGQELFCLQDLYGGLPSSYPYVFSLKRGNLIGLTNTTNHSVAMPLGLKAGHAYGLVKIAQLQIQGQLETVVQLRNVWSDASSDAAAAAGGVPWARGGADWKQCSLHQKQRVGYQLADDGTVWLTLATCLALFSTVLESRNVYQFPSVDPRNVDAVPLYVHVIANATDVVVHLEQPCRRANMQADYPCFVAPVVAAHAVVGRRKLDVAKDVIATGTFVSNRSCLVELSLPSEGTYAVIPATYAPFESAFQVVVASPVPLAVGFVSDDDIPVCSVCRQPLKGSYRTYTSPDGVVAEHVCQGRCADEYRSMHAPVCVDCRERIEVVAGRFSGRLFTLEDGTSCHAECMDNYRIRHADSCVHCHDAIVQIKVHAECMEAYQLSIAKKCHECGLAIVKGGRFDGRFYQLSGSDNQVL